MSTRANVKIHDPQVNGQPDNAIILYQHQDAMPERMIPRLHGLLRDAHELLKQSSREYWWTSERVSAVLIALSCDINRLAQFVGLLPNTDPDDLDTPTEAAVPTLLPCATVHEDIEFLYDVFLSPISGCYRIDHAEWSPKER